MDCLVTRTTLRAWQRRPLRAAVRMQRRRRRRGVRGSGCGCGRGAVTGLGLGRAVATAPGAGTGIATGCGRAGTGPYRGHGRRRHRRLRLQGNRHAVSDNNQSCLLLDKRLTVMSARHAYPPRRGLNALSGVSSSTYTV